MYLRFTTSPFLLEFLCGALLAQWLEKSRLRGSLLCLIAGAVLFCAGGLINAVVYSGMIEQGYHVLPRVIVFGIPSLLLVAGMVAVETDGHVAYRRFSIEAGGSSYAIYLSHVVILSLAWYMGLGGWLAGFGGIAGLSGYVLLVVLIFAASLLHYLLLEKRLHRLFKQVSCIGLMVRNEDWNLRDPDLGSTRWLKPQNTLEPSMQRAFQQVVMRHAVDQYEHRIQNIQELRRQADPAVRQMH